jgi:crotonobetainyl-CoA:carnitine CoA-transferase CaiB-like acyl-CoA transferase
MGSNFLHVNRNKRSLVLNLKKADGLDAFLKLVETADVVVYNIRPQAMSRLGIDYERLKAINPRIIYAGLYGYSEKGPYAGKPVHGRSRFAKLSIHDDSKVKIAPVHSDFWCDFKSLSLMGFAG